MTKEEAIKYLQQLYSNGGHCWLDEQRIEAIGMAVKALQEEPVSEELGEAANKYIKGNYSPWLYKSMFDCFKAGAQWKEQQMIEKAFSGHVIEDIEEGEGDFLLSTEYLPKSMGLKTQQKVKVIVIKEE